MAKVELGQKAIKTGDDTSAMKLHFHALLVYKNARTLVSLRKKLDDHPKGKSIKKFFIFTKDNFGSG